MTENYKKLAKMLVEHSCKIAYGEKVIIEENEVDDEFLVMLIKLIRQKGAYPFVIRKNSTVDSAIVEEGDETYFKLMTKYYLPIMQDADAYISIRGTKNIYESSDIPPQKQQSYQTHFVTPVHFEERVNNTKWVLCNWPTPSLAQSAGMSTKKYRELLFDVSTLDYSALKNQMEKYARLMEKTDKVRIISKGTDLTFSIKGNPAIVCAGEHNIPDGEVFTAPIKTSVNGVITYNVPTVYHGKMFENICLVVENGKIVKATCSGDTEALNKILDTDDGARYFGEFALGFNPFITEATGDILFDEKMDGSIHLTPGGCYDECPNENKSSIHWDMVLCQTKEYGGGELYFDDVLVRKDGIFVV